MVMTVLGRGVKTGDFFKEILDILTLPSIATS